MGHPHNSPISLEYKICKECKEELLTSKFDASPKNKGGFKPLCKKCLKVYGVSTPKKVLSRIFSNQVINSNRRGHPKPSYTRQQLTDWALNQELFLTLHRVWLTNNCHRKGAPSIDRIDDDLPYTMDNIQIMSWEENSTKANKAIRSGKITYSHKAVSAYLLDGSLFKDFVSTRDAARSIAPNSNETSVASHIGQAANNQNKTCRGYVWRWK